MAKSPARVISVSSSDFQPRFAYGDVATVVAVTGTGDGTKLGSGFVRMTKAEIPWTIQYDEVILVLDGELTVRTKGGDLVAGPQECIWLPAGTELTYVADHALMFYAIQPADWAENGSSA